MNRPIGIFDSGAGGLTVMRALIEKHPNLPLIYFGDTARLPYGDKSRETITKYTAQCIQFLIDQCVQKVVIACNTASAYTAEALRETFQLPIIDVIQPSIQEACKRSPNGRIGILGTNATIRSGCYQHKISELLPSSFTLGIPCPLLVPLVEENMQNHPATRLLIADYLKTSNTHNIDTLILGCTHYPLLKTQIAEIAGPHINIIDSAACCAQTIKVTPQITSEPSYTFYVTDDPDRFKRIAIQLLPLKESQIQVNLVHLE